MYIYGLYLISVVNVIAEFNISSITLPQTMDGHISGVFEQKYTVFAGFSNTGEYSSINTELHTTDTWTINTVPLPLTITELWVDSQQSIQANNKVYISNPKTNDANHERELIIYDLNTNTYSVGAQPSFVVSNPCVAYNGNNNILYVIGGEYVRRYNISTDTWLSDAAMIVSVRAEHGCCLDSTNTNLYIFGGYNGTLVLSSIEKYSVSADFWSIVTTATLSIARHYLKCVLLSINECIYCIGGSTSKSSYSASNVVDIFKPTTETIIDIIHLNMARFWHAVTVWNNNKCVIVSGGKIMENGLSLNSIETFGDCTANITSNPTISPTLNPTQFTTSNPTTNNASSAPTNISTFNTSNYPTLTPVLSSNPTTNNASFAPTNIPTFNTSNYPTLTPVLTSNPTTLLRVYETTNNMSYTVQQSPVNKNGDTYIIVIVVVVILIVGLFIIIICIFQRKKLYIITTQMSGTNTAENEQNIASNIMRIDSPSQQNTNENAKNVLDIDKEEIKEESKEENEGEINENDEFEDMYAEVVIKSTEGEHELYSDIDTQTIVTPDTTMGATKS